MFAASAGEKLRRLRAELAPLAEAYDVVVANPPYMGSSSLGKWMGRWAKERYPESYRDLCTAFVDRGFSLAGDEGCSAMVTMQSWMFLGSFEKLRGTILREHAILSMAHLGTRAFGAIAGEVVSTTATVFSGRKGAERGAYFRLVDMGSEEEKRAGLSEALANPDCGWFYRADAGRFEAIPGSPIAYWASEALRDSFAIMSPLAKTFESKQGLATGDSNRFLRLWWEVSEGNIGKACRNRDEALLSRLRWFPLVKGGDFRKWYGNLLHVVDWFNDGKDMKDGILNRYPYLKTPDFVVKNQQYYFRQGLTWSAVSSSFIHVRELPSGCIFDHSGDCLFCPGMDNGSLLVVQGLLNSSVGASFLRILAPGLGFDVGPVSQVPFSPHLDDFCDVIAKLVQECRSNARQDWDAFEASWDFKRHPLV